MTGSALLLLAVGAVLASAAMTGLWLVQLRTRDAALLFLLFRVTGIPATEAQALRSRADYAEYQRTTSCSCRFPLALGADRRETSDRARRVTR